MSIQPCDNVALILISFIGLHVIHFVVTYHIRIDQVPLQRSTDVEKTIAIQHQEKILRNVCQFILMTFLLWFICGLYAFLLVAIAFIAQLAVEYWCVRTTSLASRVFWARAGLGNLFYNTLFGSLAVAAYSLRHVS